MIQDSRFDTEFWQQLTAGLHPQVSFANSANRKNYIKLQVLRLSSLIMGRNVFSLLRIRNKTLDYFLSKQDELRSFYEWLNDDRSKSLMIALLVRKILGYPNLAPLINEAEESARLERARALIIKRGTGQISMGDIDFSLNIFDLMAIGYPIKAHLHETNIICTFMAEQYRYVHGGVDIGVTPEDIAIDAGGCWGDTALYMAAKGAEKVYSFEFLDDNLNILSRNKAENPALDEKVTVVKNAVWSQDDFTFSFQSAGPATTLMNNGESANSVQSITLDSFAARENLERVDFIKMDIEGAELDALMGAKDIIKRFAPKLAITVYHKNEDFVEIPRFLKSLRSDYEFYLDHFTAGPYETVLFAVSGA